jgi:glycosyltransferase involved in cell wall biosynthesis
MSKSIFFIIGQLGKGGAERQLLNLVKGLKVRGVRIQVFVWSSTAKSDMLVSYTEILKDNLFIPKQHDIIQRFIQLRKEISKANPGVVISFTNYTNIIAFLVSIFTFKKSFGSVRNSLYSKKPFFAKVKTLIMTFCPRIISNNKASIRYIKDYFSFIKTFYLPNSVEFSGSLPATVIQFDSISVGSLRTEKRIDRLLEFVKEMSERRPMYKHVHVGGGELLGYYSDLVIRAGLENNLTFCGQVDNVPDYIGRSSLLLHFSEYEGTPNAVMEAMLLKKPVISSNCGDVKELIESGVNGFVVEPYSTGEFIDKVTLCLNDRNYLSELGEQSFMKAKKFTIEHSAAMILEIIR